MMVPPISDERSGLLTFLAKQRAAVRATVRGLSEQQARKAASASDLSPLSVLRHVSRSERRWVVAGLAGRPLPGLWPITDWENEFVLDESDTVARWLADYEETARLTEQIVAELPSLDVPCALPEAAQWSARWVLLHLIEETARHAGHADIVRECLDGAKAHQLVDQ
ncbi:DinB family protein [Kutzneria viridogrisea]|uniref:Mini-circle protein n=2 Tax=Kutzneria TaxID=43356 RepID=W5WA77_9PSEU|nr:DinB family protein [Kutzneria albida]AHH97832.1 hypothetical protein KALB_4470 [Kutzneria albida DSM 43870]MBA8924581.1 hypothetical protein [Kutzneria viridogrisea]